MEDLKIIQTRVYLTNKVNNWFKQVKEDYNTIGELLKVSSYQEDGFIQYVIEVRENGAYYSTVVNQYAGDTKEQVYSMWMEKFKERGNE